jgi:hypothetical protein
MHFAPCEYELRKELMGGALAAPMQGDFTYFTPQGYGAPGAAGPMSPAVGTEGLIAPGGYGANVDYGKIPCERN